MPKSKDTTRQVNNQKEGDTRHVVYENRRGSYKAGRQLGIQGTSQLCESVSGFINKAVEVHAPRSTPTDELASNRQATESRGQEGRQLKPTT